MASEGNTESTSIITDVDGDNEENGSPTAKRNEKLQSRAWKHFDRLDIHDKTQIKARRKHCKDILSAASSNGTSHLLRHIPICRKRVNSDIRQFMLTNETSLDGTSTLKNYKFDQDAIRREIGWLFSMNDHLQLLKI